jgi:hypothetical protein
VSSIAAISKLDAIAVQEPTIPIDLESRQGTIEKYFNRLD